MSVQCPLSEVKQTSRRKAATSVFDPKPTYAGRFRCHAQVGKRPPG